MTWLQARFGYKRETRHVLRGNSFSLLRVDGATTSTYVVCFCYVNELVSSAAVSSLGLSTNGFVIQPFMNTFRFTHSALVHAGGHITDTTLTRRPTGLWPCCSLNCMFSRAFSCLLLQACFPCFIRNPTALSPICPVAMERRFCA